MATRTPRATSWAINCGRTVEFGRQRDETNLLLGRLGPEIEFFGVGRAAVALRMGASRTVFGRNIRPFQMNARDQRGEFGRLAARAADRCQARPAWPHGWRW